MCLVTKNLNFKVAHKDIKVYKIVIVSNGDNGKCYLSPFQFFTIYLNKTYVDMNGMQAYKYVGHYQIDGGVFHVYKNLCAAKRDLKYLQKRGRFEHHTLAILQGRIKKCSSYIKGKYKYSTTFLLWRKCYGVKKVIWDKEIELQ